MKYWCDNSAVWTHYGNGSSILFPAWERAFAAVIRHYLPKVTDPELKQRMESFMAEELAHANAHEAFNARYGVDEMANVEMRRTKIVHRRPGMKFWLGTMISIEHLAACFARSYLRRWGDRPERDFKLFCWHAKEELGHKALAIDLWHHLGYDDKLLNKISRINQYYVMGFLIKYTWRNVKKDGQLKNWRTWKDLVVWYCSLSFNVLIPMLTIYLPNFHPNNIDDSKYLEAA